MVRILGLRPGTEEGRGVPTSDGLGFQNTRGVRTSALVCVSTVTRFQSSQRFEELGH